MRAFGWILPGLLSAAIAAGASTAQADGFKMRISTENNLDHFQTVVVGRYADEVSKRSLGRINAEHVAEARMFRDRDVIKALQTGHAEMAVPGTWQLDRFVPDVGLFQLPLAYGRDKEVIHALIDGPVGRQIDDRIERRLQLKVLGRWIDLGYAHIFALEAPVTSYADLAGRRIRVAGGRANIQRIAGLEAVAMVVPWPDLSSAIVARSIDGVLTSYATVASARLWELGVGSAFEDQQYFAQYVPLVSRTFWERLPDDLQTLLISVWEEQVDRGRLLAEQAQQDAKAAFVEQGGRIFVPSVVDRERKRAELLKSQDGLIRELGMDPDLVDLALESEDFE